MGNDKLQSFVDFPTTEGGYICSGNSLKSSLLYAKR